MTQQKSLFGFCSSPPITLGGTTNVSKDFNFYEMVDIKTPLPVGPSITAPATTNLSATSLAPRSQVQSPESGLKNLLGSVAGSGVLGSAIGVLGNLIGDKIAYNRQQKMYNKQRQDALSDYQMQREDYLSDLADERAYNSPTAQVARLKAAGINPNTTFGSGSAPNTSSPAENTASMRGAVASSPPSASGLGNAMIQGASGLIQSSLASVESEQIKSNIELQKAQMLKMLSEIRGIDESTKGKSIENGWLDFMFESEINERYQRISESLTRQNSASIQDALNLFDLYNIKPVQRNQIIAATNKLYSEIDILSQELKLMQETHNFSVNSAMYDSWSKRYDAVLRRYESDIMATKAPTDKFDSFVQGAIHRLSLVRKALISFGKD